MSAEGRLVFHSVSHVPAVVQKRRTKPRLKTRSWRTRGVQVVLLTEDELCSDLISPPIRGDAASFTDVEKIIAQRDWEQKSLNTTSFCGTSTATSRDHDLRSVTACHRAASWAAAALWRCCHGDRPASLCSSPRCSGSSVACSTFCTSGVCSDKQTNKQQRQV